MKNQNYTCSACAEKVKNARPVGGFKLCTRCHIYLHRNGAINMSDGDHEIRINGMCGDFYTIKFQKSFSYWKRKMTFRLSLQNSDQ